MASLLEKYGWFEWLGHTNFSFLVGASYPHEILERACHLDYSGLAVCDFDGAYGLARSYLNLKKIQTDGGGKNLKLFYGAEIHFQKDHHLPLVFQDCLALIAMSHRGYSQLCQILSFAHRFAKHDAFVELEDLLKFETSDLVAIQPMRGLIRLRKNEALQQRSQILKEAFPGRFYFTIGRYANPAEDHWIEPSILLAQKIEVPLLLNQDIFFHDAAQKPMSDLLNAIRLNKPVADINEYLFANDQRCLQPLHQIEKMYGKFTFFEKALINAKNLADKIDFTFSELKYEYPKEMIPDGFSSQKFFEDLVWKSAQERYQGQIPAKITELLKKELFIIRDLAFADHFLTVWDIVRWANSKNILCQGRGSAANSAVCFVLGITSAQPDLFDALFERFLSVERGDPPDIDVDFEHERREEVIQYIYQRYGRERAAMVANVITFRSKGAIRFSGKALGISESILAEAASILKTRFYRRQSSSKTLESLAGKSLYDEDFWQLWGTLSERLRGFPKHLSIHSGGFVLSQRSIDWLCPREPATMAGRSIVQWCKEDIEGLGFFKVDILALGILTALRKSFDSIKKLRHQNLTLANLPQDDVPTYQMIQNADTVGVFQIESRAQMSMLPRLKPKNYYDLVVEVAIIRPGPIQGGMIHPYLKRRNKLEPITFPDPRLIPILKRTFGVPIFQEQIMRIAMAVGGFSAGEADELRKNIGSFSMKGDVSKWIGKLEIGMRKNGLAESFIASTLGQLKGFASYGFPESHAASFALLAYASSYLKCHYPADFFVALLNSQPMGFYSRHTLLQAAKHAGVKVLGVCVNHSDWDTTLEPIANSKHPFAIRLGFSMVNCLSEKAAKILMARRQKKVPQSWPDFLTFLKESTLSRVDLTALAAAEALKVFGLDRRSAIWLAEAAPYCHFLEDVEEPSQFSKEEPIERFHLDFNAFNTTLEDHPTKLLRELSWIYDLNPKKLSFANTMLKLQPNQMVWVFGLVIIRQAPPTAKDVVFVTLEDETGFINLVFHGPIYEKFHKMIDRSAFLCVYGKRQSQDGAVAILVKQVLSPKVNAATVIPMPEQAEAAQLIANQNEELEISRNYM